MNRSEFILASVHCSLSICRNAGILTHTPRTVITTAPAAQDLALAGIVQISKSQANLLTPLSSLTMLRWSVLVVQNGFKREGPRFALCSPPTVTALD